MLKRLRTAHPIVFCVLAEVVFLASLFVTDLIFTIVLVLLRADFSALDTYLYSTLQELVGVLVTVWILKRTGRAGLLRRRGSGFFNGLLVGMYPLVVIGQKMVSGIDSWLLIAIPLFILAGNLMNAGMSGSASADAGGLGAIEIKAMRDHGYDDDFPAAVTAASSVIDPILPPSIPLIIY